MTGWVIIPVKPFQEGKSRLDGILEDDQREQLNIFLFRYTLKIVSALKSRPNILIVSRERQVLSYAREFGASMVVETGKAGLNRALYQANNSIENKTDYVLILPTDLPLINVQDIEYLLEKGAIPPVVVVVPDRSEYGTNALMVNPVGSIPYRFGRNSAKKHVEAARKRNIRVHLEKMANLCRDLDMPEDLELLEPLGFPIPMKANTSIKE